MKTLTQIYESFRFAWRALKANVLRTILSLLSVTVGIFLIISVLTLVDSLEKNIKDSLNFLGAGVIYVDKWPFPSANQEYKWWDFLKRPTPSYNEYKFLKANLEEQSSIAIFADRGNQILKKGNNSIGQIQLIGASIGYDQLFDVNIEQGRYMSVEEIESGRNIAVLGF